MPEPNDQRTITIISACMRKDGCPDFALTEITATQEEIDNGAHFYLAEADLLERGYEEPFVHFGEDEMPTFLLPGVKKYLQQRAIQEQANQTTEESRCRA